ncbi:uncharacterized protein [Dermacentor andersoni]|uniref:uncharacterized protein isoform X2 n=1 Tax=Dermacentor andersoni TaxID=34620 RepID=UPI0024159ED1|nr:uncharacterized protein LOC129384264 isoform X2 [Dermacentor andersoni]
MVAARFLSLVFLTVLCGVRDAVCEALEGCGDPSTEATTSTPVPTTTTTPPKDYALYRKGGCLYKGLKSGRHMYPTSCRKLCLKGRPRTRLVTRQLPFMTKCLKLAEDFAERSLNSQQCRVGYCMYGYCMPTTSRVNCYVPANKTAPSSKAEK